MAPNRHRFLTAAVVAGLIAAVGALGVTVRGSAPAGERGDLQSLLDSWRARADVPAVVLAAQDASGNRRLLASGTGRRNRPTAVTTDARFRIASITKLFVATVVLQLVEERRLGLDDAVSQYVRPLPVGGVTIRQLLNHTSGIPDYSSTAGWGERLLGQRNRRWRTEHVLDLVADVQPDFAPGAGYQYSNTGYVLLGEVITAATGVGWALEVRRRILEPLGLDDTYVAGFEPSQGHVLPGYFDADNDGDVENIEAAGAWPALETSEGPAGAIVSTASDVLTFGGALFQGDLVSDRSRRQMTTEGPFHPRNSNYGLGVEIVRPDYDTTTWGHGGHLPGFRSVLWYVPSRDALVTVLANDSRANPSDLAELVMRTLPERDHGR